MSGRSPRRPLVLGLPPVLVAGVVPVVSQAAAATGSVQIVTLSNRADLVSGGDVLTRVVLPRGVRASSLHLTLNGHDVTRQLKLRSGSQAVGVVSGLRLGRNA